MANNTFTIKFGDRVLADSSTPPEDPLHELSEVEMGLWRYCHDCNKSFWFEINDRPLELADRRCVLTLDPDLSFLLPDLPRQIEAFIHGEPLKLTFGEKCLSVQFVPIGDQIRLEASAFGLRTATAKLMLKKNECESQWKRFVDEIVSDAVALGYLAAGVGDAFLANADTGKLVMQEKR